MTVEQLKAAGPARLRKLEGLGRPGFNQIIELLRALDRQKAAIDEQTKPAHADFVLPDRIKRLPIDEEGFPVPYFVPYVNGRPEFRGFDGEKLGICVRQKRCWLCGEPLGKFMVFVIGPMCAVNRTSAEPPSHRDCPQFAVRACPVPDAAEDAPQRKGHPRSSGAGGHHAEAQSRRHAVLDDAELQAVQG